MEDWLRLLDFSVESSGSSFFQVPLQRAALAERRGLMERVCGNRFLPVGAYYCILAKKTRLLQVTTETSLAGAESHCLARTGRSGSFP